MRGQYVFLMAKSQSSYIRFVLSIVIAGDSASFFIEMIMLCCLEGILTQTRMGVGKEFSLGF